MENLYFSQVSTHTHTQKNLSDGSGGYGIKYLRNYRLLLNELRKYVTLAYRQTYNSSVFDMIRPHHFSKGTRALAMPKTLPY